MMVAVTALFCVFCGCSQDDDYYDSDMYTLAEMGTRLGEGGGDPGGGSGNVDEEFTITRSINWKETEADSVTLTTCNVTMKLAYNHYNMGGGVTYDSHNGDDLTNIVVMNGNCFRRGKYLHYTVRLRANYIAGNGSPNDSMSVIGSTHGSFIAFK